jgi:hypothetical protein
MKPAFWKPSRTALAVDCFAVASLERKGAKSMSCYMARQKRLGEVRTDWTRTGMTKSSFETACSCEVPAIVGGMWCRAIGASRHRSRGFSRYAKICWQTDGDQKTQRVRSPRPSPPWLDHVEMPSVVKRGTYRTRKVQTSLEIRWGG